MRTSTLLCTGAVLLSAVACSGRAPDPASGVSGDLEKDLAKVSTSSLELASEARAYQATRVVSDIERTDRAVPVERRKVPKPVVRNVTGDSRDDVKSPAPIPQNVLAQLEDPEPQPDSPAAADDDVPRVPSVAPRPAALPVSDPSAEGGSAGRSRGTYGGGPTPDIPTIIGIMIQGVGRGDDHCVPHSGPRPRGPGMRIPPSNR